MILYLAEFFNIRRIILDIIMTFDFNIYLLYIKQI